MDLNNENVLSLAKKKPSEIKAWLDRIIANNKDYNTLLKDFNLVYLKDYLRVYDGEKIDVEVGELVVYVYQLLQEIYPSPLESNYYAEMNTRALLLNEYGIDSENGKKQLEHIMSWIGAESIKVNEVTSLLRTINETEEAEDKRQLLIQLQNIKFKNGIVRRLLELDISVSSELIEVVKLLE